MAGERGGTVASATNGSLWGIVGSAWCVISISAVGIGSTTRWRGLCSRDVVFARVRENRMGVVQQAAKGDELQDFYGSFANAQALREKFRKD